VGLLDYNPFGASTDVTFGVEAPLPAYAGYHPGVAAYQHEQARGYLGQRQALARQYYEALAGGASAARAQQALGTGAALQEGRMAGAASPLAARAAMFGAGRRMSEAVAEQAFRRAQEQAAAQAMVQEGRLAQQQQAEQEAAQALSYFGAAQSRRLAEEQAAQQVRLSEEQQQEQAKAQAIGAATSAVSAGLAKMGG